MNTAFYIPQSSVRLQQRKPTGMSLFIPQHRLMPGFRVHSMMFGSERPVLRPNNICRKSHWSLDPCRSWASGPWIDNEDWDFGMWPPEPMEATRCSRCEHMKGIGTQETRKRHASRSSSSASRSCPRKKSDGDVKQTENTGQIFEGFSDNKPSDRLHTRKTDDSKSTITRETESKSSPTSASRNQTEGMSSQLQEDKNGHISHNLDGDPTMWTEFVKVEGFSPENLRTKLTHDGRLVTVSGREEISHGPDGDLVEYHEMRRELRVPEDVDLNKLRTFFFSDGRLRLQAPRMGSRVPGSDMSQTLGDLSLEEIERDMDVQTPISPLPDTPCVEPKPNEEYSGGTNNQDKMSNKFHGTVTTDETTPCESETRDLNSDDPTDSSVVGLDCNNSDDDETETHVILD